MVRFAILCVLAVTSTAAAKGWPTPAAGASASGDPEILFTFDDGPSPVHTPKVLDLLKKHHIKAVFFMVGEMVESGNKKVPAILQRIVREGHVLANHTMTHADLCRVKEEKAIAEIDKGKAAIEKASGMPVVWFRAPFGVRCDRLESELAERNTKHMHWDFDPQEWKHGDTAKTVSYVTGSLARSSARNVLLMHDIKPVTVEALPEILTWLDEENAQRKKDGKRPIRVLQAPALAIEQFPPGLTTWAGDVIDRLRGVREDIARVLP
jgi:peptidoglycan/xylan/chitin deacetylase (PgdA/CDA1 family)